jgi:endonuclease/exonuclease/phosphatase (EEP) superfamily protein YafD
VGIFRSIFTVAHVVIVLLLGATMLNAYIPPKVFPFLNLLSLAFPFLMIANLLLCFFWIFSWRKRAFVFLLISTLFLTPVRRWINYSEPKSEENSIKVISYNARIVGWETINPTSDFIDEQNADVILMQECGDRKIVKPKSSKYTIIDDYKIMTIYTKHPIIEHGLILENRMAGNAHYADIDISGKRIRFINVYLEPYKLHEDLQETPENIDNTEKKAKTIVGKMLPIFKKHQEQVEKIAAFIKKSPYPVILAGDFNAVPNSYEYYKLSEGLQDAFLESGKGSGTSFHDYIFPLRIDYIFASKEFESNSFKVKRNLGLTSDHYPVFAEFSFKN